MKKTVLTYSLLVTLFATIGFWITSCNKNPVTGRTSLNLVNDATMLSLSGAEYTSFLNANPPVSGSDADRVKRVGARVSTAVQQYLSSIGKLSAIDNYQWEFNLVNNAEANAWCMPGGKVVFYTGILPLIANDTELAVVMGHEIAHAVSKHGNERMTDQLIAQYGGVALSVLLSDKPAETQNLFNTVFGITTNLGILAYSRKHENEADEIGLYFMSMAGYNPNAAVSFWEKMAAQGGSKPPVILSTHPDDQTRIDHIKSLLPKALQYYHP